MMKIVIKDIHRVIQFNQESWLKPYIDMNIKLRTEAKNDFEKYFKLMNNSVFGKTMENVRKHKDIKLVTTDKRLFRRLISNRSEENKSKMNMPVYLGMSILDISKTLMYELWYDYIETKV